MLALKVTKFWSFYLRCIFPSKEPRAKWCHGLNNQFPDKIPKFNAKEIGSSLFFGMEFSYQQKLELMFDENTDIVCPEAEDGYEKDEFFSVESIFVFS